jgi:transcriptional regulator with XRE-family HTH domain
VAALIIDTDSPSTGLELRLVRVSRRVSIAGVARRAGLSRQRIQAIEGSDRPTSRAVRRYLAALEAAALDR